MRKTIGSLLLVLGVLASASTVLASGFDSTRIGGEFGHAAAPNPFATYYNPAALGGTRKVHLAADLSLALHSARYRRTDTAVPEPDDAAGSNRGTSKLFDVMVAPTLAGSMRWGDLTVGLGFFAPMSGSMSWNENERFGSDTNYPGARDGQARWHMIEGDQQTLYGSAGVSYTISAIGLSFGAGANLIYQRVRLLRARTGLGDDDLNAEGRIDLDVSGLSGSFSIGAFWEILPNKLWLGLSYQAPPGLYDGTMLTGNLRTYLGTGSSTTAVQLKNKLPDIIRWALRYRAQRYELRLFGDISRWKMMRRQCLVAEGEACDLWSDGSEVEGGEVISNHVRAWKTTFGVRTGASYWFTPSLEGFAGVGYDGNAIPSAHLEPGLLDGHDISGVLGARIALGSRLALALSYTHVHMLARKVTNSQVDSLMPPSRLPPANGEYKQWLGLFNAFLEVYFN